MARRGVRGQLHMFDFVHSLDAETSGEVEMVSLMPDFDEPEIVEEPITQPESIAEPEPIAEETQTEESNPVIDEVPMQEEKSELEETSVIEEKPAVDTKKVAMSRRYQIDGKEIEIAYINYNKVRITREGEAPIIKEFTSTKEAVDFYVEQIQEEDTDE